MITIHNHTGNIIYLPGTPKILPGRNIPFDDRKLVGNDVLVTKLKNLILDGSIVVTRSGVVVTVATLLSIEQDTEDTVLAPSSTTRTFIPLRTIGRVAGNTSSAWFQAGSWYFDPAEWPDDVIITLRVEGYNSMVMNCGEFRLVDLTQGITVVAGVVNSLDSTVVEVTLPSIGATQLGLQQRCNINDPAASAYLLGATLILEVP